MQIVTPRNKGIATEAGTFTAVTEVGLQPQPGTREFEALQEVLHKAVATGKPVQVIVQRE